MGFLKWLRTSMRPRDRRDGRQTRVMPRAATAFSDDTPIYVAVGDLLPRLNAPPGHAVSGAGWVTDELLNAVFLHRNGRKEQAWAVFEKLLQDTEVRGAAALRPLLHGEIYSRMRMCLERDGCSRAAVTPAVLSYAARAQFYALQGRADELRALQASDRFDSHFAPLLQRAQLGHVSLTLCHLVERHLRDLPRLDRTALKASLEHFLETGPESAAPALRGDAAVRSAGATVDD